WFVLGWGARALLPMLLSSRYGCRARRRSFAAGMALALAGRAAGLIPAFHPTTTTTAAMRSSSRQLMKATAATTTVPSRASPRRRYLGAATKDARASLLSRSGSGGSAGVRWPASGGARIMSASGSSTAMCSTQSSYEMTAGDLALEAQIKTKGDAIRDLKAGGASKDDLKPHIEELLELKQLYVKATGEAFGAPSGGKGNTDSDKKKKKSKGGGDGQPKQMDTRKADKARKVDE
ncbi:unnamed protein product, partial [Laminaria digitata]